MVSSEIMSVAWCNLYGIHNPPSKTLPLLTDTPFSSRTELFRRQLLYLAAQSQTARWTVTPF